MVKKIPNIGKALDKWELTIRDSFNMKALYKRLHYFLKDEEWVDMHSGGDNFEVKYSQVTDAAGLRFYQIWWRAERMPHAASNGYYHYYLKLNMDTRALGTKEEIVDGKKVTLDNGELVVKAWFYLVENANAEPEWESNFFLKLFRKQFWNQMKQSDTDLAEQELIDFSQQLYNLFQVSTGIYPEDEHKDYYMRPRAIEK